MLEVGSAIDTGQRPISGIVIIEVFLGSDGRVQEARVVKPLASQAVNEAALDLVKGAAYLPAAVFGIPVPIIHNFTAYVVEGRVRIAGRRAAD